MPMTYVSCDNRLKCFRGVISNQWRTQEFFSGEGGSTNSVEDRENGDLGAVAP